jgi:hypothetical protein
MLPLALVNVFNVACGFYGLRAVDVPMFLCLRRTAIGFIIALDFVLRGVRAGSITLLSVSMICGGAIVAGYETLDANFIGYVWITLNNVLTAAYLSLVLCFEPCCCCYVLFLRHFCVWVCVCVSGSPAKEVHGQHGKDDATGVVSGRVGDGFGGGGPGLHCGGHPVVLGPWKPAPHDFVRGCAW